MVAVKGRQWWKKSDDPWQTLACCKEIAKAMRSPDPALFISHFPIHQDGSCNGLQHYAALGRDQKGAEQVNLVPFDTPQDVYNGVASLVCSYLIMIQPEITVQHLLFQVEEQRKKDAEDGVEIAKSLDGFVSRKVSRLSAGIFSRRNRNLVQVVKQTVMTIVYGVTRYGARGQIRGQLSDLKEFDQKKVPAAAAYLAGKTFDSIKQMFSSARKIQVY